jgi:hypothetical protein
MQKVSKLPTATVVRDTFSFPKNELERIDDLRSRVAQIGGGMFTKSEVVRAALAAAAAMPPEEFQRHLDGLIRLRPGRK